MCQFDSPIQILKPIKPHHMEKIKLTVGCIYKIENNNYVLDSYSDSFVKLKYLVDGVVKIRELSMAYFLNSNPVNFGKL